jgi:putative hemolysin
MEPQLEKTEEQNLPNETPLNQNNNAVKGRKKISLIEKIFALWLILTFLICGYIISLKFTTHTEVATYDECLKAKGSMIQESYPQRCVTKDGQIFTQQVEPEIPNIMNAEDCYKKVQKDLESSECPQGADCMAMYTDPESIFCTCMGGENITKEQMSGDTYMVCVINGEEYTGVNFQEFSQGWYWGDVDQKKPGTPDDWVLSGSGTRSSYWHKPSIDEGECSKIGEPPVDNFDLTTGKTNPNIEPVPCCISLKPISKKQDANLTDNNICVTVEGVINDICSPCGNGVCDSEYEDLCNCPEDCN